MTERSSGFYWIREYSIWQDNRTGYHRVEPGETVVAQWTGARWCLPGFTATTDLDVADADVLAGPLQAPSTAPIMSGITGQPIDDWDGSLRRRLDRDAMESETTAWMSEALSTMKALRSRARALLEGTTPGPWDDGDNLSIRGDGGGPGGSVVAMCFAGRCYADRDLVLGAHALLTELAKEEA